MLHGLDPARYLFSCNVPFWCSTIVQAGYVGEDVESILHKLYMESGQDIDRCQRGIVYIDEIDKASSWAARTRL